MKIDREKEIITKGGGGQLNRAQFVKQSIGERGIRETQPFSGNDRKREFQRRAQPERT